MDNVLGKKTFWSGLSGASENGTGWEHFLHSTKKNGFPIGIVAMTASVVETVIQPANAENSQFWLGVFAT
jgi:hypothetical protein